MFTNTGRYIYKAHDFQNISMMSNAVRLINLTTCIKPYMFICWFEERRVSSDIISCNVF